MLDFAKKSNKVLFFGVCILYKNIQYVIEIQVKYKLTIFLIMKKSQRNGRIKKENERVVLNLHELNV